MFNIGYALKTTKANLTLIQSNPECKILPPSGQPTVPLALPQGLREFYSLCGGVELFTESDYSLSIVCPRDFVRANPVIAGVEGGDDISFDWFIIGKSGEQYITIDLHPDRLGRCYDSFWDRHAIRGSSLIIARSFPEFLRRAFESGGHGWFWLAPSFRPMEMLIAESSVRDRGQNYTMKTLLHFAFVILLFALAGCTSGPSHSGQNSAPTLKGYIDTSVEKRF